MKLAFNMIWLRDVLQICTEEQLVIKYCMIKHLILLKIQNMYTKEVLFQWFINVLIKSNQVVPVQVKVCQAMN